MCEACHEESDDDYEGDSIEERRNRALASVVDRHPELGLAPEDVRLRYAPRAEERCVRAHVGPESPRYEIHRPSYTAQFAADGPPLRELAVAARVETDRSLAALCDLLGIDCRPRYGALFVSETPPLNSARADAVPRVDDYEAAVAASFDEEADPPADRRDEDAPERAAVEGVFDAVEGPTVTAVDVARELGCTRAAALEALDALVESGDLARREADRVVLYWRPSTDE